MKKILIVGKNGQVGWELQNSLAHTGKVIAYDRQGLDLCHPDQISKLIREVKPDVIINAAAYTLVDKAETDETMAMAINGNAVGVLAEEAKKLETLLIHYSTDYVFDGTKTSPYHETDAVCPLNAYGRSKLAGEKALLAIGGKYLILRTSWVYGMRGANFLLTMLRLGRERKELKVVDDQVGTPTWSRLLAEKTAEVISTYSQREFDKDLSGVYHMTPSGRTSWCGFAEAIFDECQKTDRKPLTDFQPPKLIKIPSTEYPTPAVRPKFSVLSNDKIHRTFGIVMPDWKEALCRCLSRAS